ncbi:MAG: hypothetical protein JST01_23380 [Cyanobacteria bacterium SZAS TMP-1]|nr:hypothetical protein [Cyanobacteria bacterium SZAS TMP-1]
MNPAILVIANLVLFVASIIGGFLALQLLTHKVIGFFRGGRLLAFTEGDARSQRKHRLLLAGSLVAVKALSVLAFVTLGAALWSSYALAVTIGLVLGVLASFHSSKHSLLPEGWKRQD